MDAHSIDTNFDFPERMAAPQEHEGWGRAEFGPVRDEGMGAFRGLAAALMIQIGVALLAVLGWQVWHALR